MLFKFWCVSLMVAAVLADDVKFEDCGKGEVEKVMVSGCDKTKCVIHRGKPLEVQVVFKANQDSKQVNIELTVIVDNIQVEVSDIDTNACHHMTCPLVKGHDYTFDYSWIVPKVFPITNNLSVEARFIGDKGVLACGLVKHIQVVD